MVIIFERVRQSDLLLWVLPAINAMLSLLLVLVFLLFFLKKNNVCVHFQITEGC